MSEDQSHSGSRWEPAPAAAAPERPEPTPATGAPTVDNTTVASGYAPSAGDRRGRRPFVVAAAVGAVLLFGGAAGGYAIGHATATATGNSVHERGAGGPDGLRGHGNDTPGLRTPGLSGTGTPAGGTST